MTLTQFVVGILFGIVPLLLGMKIRDNPELVEEIGAFGSSGNWSESHSKLLAWFLILVGVFDLVLFFIDMSA
ncbi:MAG: hypothetical protein KC917_21705 [Candidatus Omnitrophica bacterium]|nr:hypothetical protein [Candidatus Omnitrophota bacterium]